MFKTFALAVAAIMIMAGAAHAADFTVGVFNSQSLAMESDPAKEAQRRMQSQFGSERTQLEKQAKDLQKQGEDFQGKAATLSQKAREEQQMDLMRKSRAFDDKSRDFARRVDGTENQMRQSMAQFILQAATNVAQQKNLDLVLDAAAGSVVFAKPALDISKDMTAEVNRLWKAGGSKFPTPPAAGKK